MSRAVFLVVRYGSFAPPLATHCSAMVVAVSACFATSPGPCAYLEKTLVICSGDRSQLTGVLCPTPRGSKPIRSYDFNRLAGAPPPASAAGIPSPAAPGPPGLSSSTPRRRPGSLLRIRETAISMVLPFGSW